MIRKLLGLSVRTKLVLLFAGVPLGMVFVQLAAARLVAAAWEVKPPPDAPSDKPWFALKVKGREQPLVVELDDQARRRLWLSWGTLWFDGLPFNGPLLDPKLMTLWLIENKAGGERLKQDQFDKRDLAELSAKVEATIGWPHAAMRWIYRLFGSDPIGFVLLTLSFWVFAYCLHEFVRFRETYTGLKGFSRVKPFSEIDIVSGKPWKPLDNALKAHRGQPPPDAAGPPPGDVATPAEPTYPGSDPRKLPYDILEAAVSARKLYRAERDREAAWKTYKDSVAAIMENLEHRLAPVQYAAQIIAPLGFIGTVLHLGLAMGHAQSLTEGGGIGTVTSSLGMAFDTTFVALVLWIVVEFFALRERTARLGVRDEAMQLVMGTIFSPNARGAEVLPAGPDGAAAPQKPQRPAGER